MAGIKITDLSALSVAEATDYLCIVDVSDTSQSPAGTTKKIEVGNMPTQLKNDVVTIAEVDVLAGGTFELVPAISGKAFDIISVVSLIKDQISTYDATGNILINVEETQFIIDAQLALQLSVKGYKYNQPNPNQPNVWLNSPINCVIPPSSIGDGSLTFYILYRELTF